MTSLTIGVLYGPGASGKEMKKGREKREKREKRVLQCGRERGT
jgi:hypothetical protein